MKKEKNKFGKLDPIKELTFLQGKYSREVTVLKFTERIEVVLFTAEKQASSCHNYDAIASRHKTIWDTEKTDKLVRQTSALRTFAAALQIRVKALEDEGAS